jgi:hypothetical protein
MRNGCLRSLDAGRKGLSGFHLSIVNLTVSMATLEPDRMPGSMAHMAPNSKLDCRTAEDSMPAYISLFGLERTTGEDIPAEHKEPVHKAGDNRFWVASPTEVLLGPGREPRGISL